MAATKKLKENGTRQLVLPAVAPPKSTVLNCEMDKVDLVALKAPEQFETKPKLTIEQVDRCFAILDELIPKLGVYVRPMQLLREELFEFSHSREYTSDRNGTIRPLPYFALVEKYRTVASLHSVNLEAKYEESLATIKSLNLQLEEKSLNFDRSRDLIKKCEQERADMKSLMDSEIAKSKEDVKKSKVKELELEAKVVELMAKVGALKEELRALKLENTFHKKFYNAYLEMKSKFEEPFSLKVDRKVLDASQKSYAKSSLDEAKKHRSHLGVIRNRAISDYDAFLVDLGQRSATLGGDEVQRLLTKTRDKYQAILSDLAEESVLNSAHVASLEKQVAVFNSREVVQYEARDKFFSQEGVLSRFSLTLSISMDKGHSFLPLKISQFCHGCGVVTTVCPHKLFGASAILTLPLAATHIKLAHPDLHLNTPSESEHHGSKHSKKGHSEGAAKDQSDTSASKVSVHSHDPSKGSSSIGNSTEQTSHQTPSRGSSVEANNSLSSSAKGGFSSLNLIVHKALEKLGEQRHLVPDQTRTLSYTECSALMDDLGASYILHCNSNPPENERVLLSEFLLTFLHERYILADVAFQVLREMIVGIQQYAPSEQKAEFFGALLSSSLSPVSLLYVSHILSVVKDQSWESSRHARPVMQEIYPFLVATDLDSLMLHYQSYCANVFTLSSLGEFIQSLFLKGKEPRVVKMLDLLNSAQTRTSQNTIASLSLEEAQKFAVSVFPYDNYREKVAMYFHLSPMSESGRGVSVVHVAQIMSFIELITLHSKYFKTFLG